MIYYKVLLNITVVIVRNQKKLSFLKSRTKVLLQLFLQIGTELVANYTYAINFYHAEVV